MIQYTQQQRALEVFTPLGADRLLLTGFTGAEGISQLFHFRLDLLAENRQEVPFDRLLGQPVAVRLSLGRDGERYFHGIVSGMSQGWRDQTFTHYQAEVVPHLWLLTKRRQSRVFQQLTVPDILRKVFAGMDVDFQIVGRFEPREYCVQYGETDFNFASRLMEEEGIYYFFRHGRSGHKLIVADTPQSHPELPGQSRVSYDPVEAEFRKDFRIRQWEKAQQLCSGRYTLWDHCFELPHQPLAAQTAIPSSVEVGKVTHKLQVGDSNGLEVYDYPGGYAHRFDGIDRGGAECPDKLTKIFEDNQRTVKLRAQQEAAASLTIRGASDCRHFTSGHRFTLERHFNADGAYVLTGVEHTASLSGGFRSGSDATLAYENRFTCIPLALPFRPARATPRPRIEGAQTAVVVGPPGSEVFCDKYGRVKVQFHWDREGKKDQDSSCWVRVGTPWAGKRRGVIHVPMVGDEVIVDFLEGDPDRPIIVGSVYNAEMMPPYELPANNKASGYKGDTGSNYAKTVNVKGKELWHTNVEKDYHMTVGNISLVEVTSYHRMDAHDIFLNAKEKIHLTVGGNFIRIEQDGIYIYANKIYMGAGETITQEAGTAHSTKAPTITAEAKATHTTKAGIITAEAAATHTVKGGVVKINC